ncbi:MAG: hypothetical protein U0271_04880 [Polyangiaceae bacterium]
MWLFAYGAAADEVKLKSGGRVRGTIMEEDPKSGVRIQLADGTVRVIEAGKVDKVIYDEAKPPQKAEPEPPPPKVEKKPEKGQVEITSDEDGVAYAATALRLGRRKRFAPPVRLGEVKAGEPLTVNVSPGTQKIEVEFERGGSDADLVQVDADTPVSVDMHGLGYWHDGPRVWIGAVIPALWASFGSRDSRVGVDFQFQVAMTYKLSDLFGLRGAVRLGGGFGMADVAFGAEAVARLSLTSVYGIELGLDGGVLHDTDPFVLSPAGYIGLRASVLSLRVGPHRNAELAVRNSLPVMLYPGADPTFGFSAELSFAVMAFGE